MSNSPNALWLSVSPSWQRFHRPLLRLLSHHTQIAQWEYSQGQDEACSLEIALTLLHDYLKSRSQPVHLLGHSTGGLLGLLYARQYPQRVRSLTLLAVGVYPAVDWQAHYYVLRQLLPCSNQIVLAQMVRTLFGHSDRWQVKKLVQLLEQDLQTSPSPHSLFQRGRIPPGGVDVPLLVCG